MAKSREKIEARLLRKNGESIKVIADKLKVSAGSVSAWCRDISLTQIQTALLKIRIINRSYGKRIIYLQKQKIEFDKKVNKLKDEGIKAIGKLTEREIFLIGVSLYWGEGFKKDHLVGLATSDAKMARFFIYWLGRCCGISQDRLILRVTANFSYKDSINDIEKYWADELKIPLNQFSLPYFQKTKWKKIYENKNQYHGVVRIKVRRSISLLRKIYGYLEGIRSIE